MYVYIRAYMVLHKKTINDLLDMINRKKWKEN